MVPNAACASTTLGGGRLLTYYLDLGEQGTHLYERLNFWEHTRAKTMGFDLHFELVQPRLV